MHKLNRGVAPSCLSRYQHGRDNWKSLSSTDKDEIWTELDAMQAKRCAYCECEIGSVVRHIEHFVQKGRVPSETFNWDNLFGSCCIEGSCGKLKDRLGAYDHSQVVKPDIDNPDDYLLFISDGTIVPAKGISNIALTRSNETLRVLGLHHRNGQLRNMRRLAIFGYIQTAEEYAEFACEDPNNDWGWREELERELEAVSMLPFATAIRHVMQAYLGP